MLNTAQKQQAVELLKEAKRIILLSHKNPDGDALGSLLGFSRVLKNLGKEVKPVYFGTPEGELSFLPGYNLLSSSLKEEEIILTLKGISHSDASLMYRKDEEEEALQIKLKLRNKIINPQDIAIETKVFTPDLLIAVDLADLTQISKELENASLDIQNLAVLNIDHHKTNTLFGKINLVDANATATTEILVSLVEALGGSLNNNSGSSKSTNLFNEDIATCFLCGILSDTGMFQNRNTTPKSLTVAAQLIALGGRREQIVKHLFKRKSLPYLQLVAKVIERIHREEGGFFWSYLLLKDLEEAGTKENEANRLIDQELKNIEEANLILLLEETGEGIRGHLRALRDEIDAASLAKLFSGGGHSGAGGFLIQKPTTKENLLEIVQKIKTAIISD